MEEKKIIKGILLTGMFVCIVGLIYIILAYSKYYFHSDCAGYLFLAKEQLTQKKMFPIGFHYTTDIFFLTPSITMIPFLAILDNELLAHELGVLLYIVILCVLIFTLFRENKKAGIIVITCFLLPLSWVVIDMFFSQGAYLAGCLFKVLLLIAIQYLFKIEDHNDYKKIGISYLYYLFVGFLVNYATIRGIATDMLPIFFSFIIMIIIREGISLKGFFKQKRLLLYSVCTMAIIAISGVHYILLCNRLNFESQSLTNGLVDSSSFYQNILKFPALVLELLGWTSTFNLFSMATLKTCGILVYIIISQIIIPIYLLTKVSKISSSFMQFIVLYVNISNFITIFMMVSSGRMESRYYLPVYFNNLLLLGLMGKWLLDEKYESFKMVPALSVLVLTIFVYGVYIPSVPESWKQNINLFDPKGNSQFYDFLLDNDLTYGYASFWTAYPITVLSNEEIIVVAHDAGKPTVPYYFNENSLDDYKYYAVSEKYYDTDLHSGRCFVLVLAGESIPDQYYRLADEMLTYEGFTILVYEKNINEYPELVITQ